MHPKIKTCKPLIWIRGAGDLATGVGVRLLNAGFSVVYSEIQNPTVIRTTISFATAVYEGAYTVEGHIAKRCSTIDDIYQTLEKKQTPVYIGDESLGVSALRPQVFVEATIRKIAFDIPKNLVKHTIGLGPGFKAPSDVDAVVETMRGHNLGRVIWEGTAKPNTGIPGDIGGYTKERVIHAEVAGIFTGNSLIGDMVTAGQVIAHIGSETQVKATITGILRGLIHDELYIEKGTKIADIDPRCEVNHCFTVSDKARAIGGGVLEAILHLTA